MKKRILKIALGIIAGFILLIGIALLTYGGPYPTLGHPLN